MEGMFTEDWERPLLRNIPIEDKQTTIEQKMLSSKLDNLLLSIKDGGYADYLEPSSNNPILNTLGLKARNYLYTQGSELFVCTIISDFWQLC